MSDLIKVNTPRERSLGSCIQQEFSYGPAKPAIDPLWFWLAIRKRKLLILLTLLAVVLPTALFVQFAEPVCRATATIQIDPESAKVLPYKEITDPLANPVPHFELYLKTQDALLRSSALADRTRKRVRQEFPNLGAAALPEDLARDLAIERIEGSQMLKISYLASDPRLAAAVANAWAEELIAFHLERRAQTGEKATEFLQGQLKILKQKVEKAEKELVDYARSHNILNIDSRQENVIRQRFGYLNAELPKAEKEFIARRAEYEGLRPASVEDFPENLKSPVIASLENRVFQAEQELSRLLAQFGEKWPAVVQKKQELAVVRVQLAQAKQTGLAGARKQAEIALKAAANEFDMLHKAYKAQEGLVNELNQASVEYNSLKRDFETSEQLYQGLLQRLKETGVSSGLELGNIQLVDRAQPVSTPYRPRKALSVVLALILGLTLGVGLSVILEYQDNTVRDPWEVEQFGLPLLTWVPKVNNGVHLKDGHGRGNGAVLIPREMPGLAGTPVSRRTEGRIRESYRMLSASLLLSRAESPPRTILVTSATPKEGKTTTTAALGTVFAEMGSPTLVIDADLRNASLAARFGLGDTSEGLSTFLAGGKLVIQETSTPNLYVMPPGPTPPNPVALFSGDLISKALRELSTRFKFVLLDGPPVLGLADAHVLATKVDGVILVVHAGRTPKEILRKSLLSLNRASACVLGFTVNQVDLKNPQYSQYEKYYYDEQARTKVGV